MVYLRQPIISVLGHVDHGKTSFLDFIRKSKIINKEAGGITQHIGATEVPQENVIKIVKGMIPKEAIKIPGLLFIDTPGHKAFTSLRKRGGSISDIGILIVDINEGFMPQTIEAIEILKSMNTPFIVAANKIDVIPGWKSKNHLPLLKDIASQTEEVNLRFEEKLYHLVGKINEFGFESDRYDRVMDFTKQVAIVPISAKTGEGVKELITTLVGLTQKYMEKKLTITDTSLGKGVILEVKDYSGLGKTIDVILYEGIIKQNDIVLALDINEVQQSYLKSILKPKELTEICNSSTKFKTIKEVHAASGIKLACPDFVDIKAGMPIISLRKNVSKEEIAKYKKELSLENTDITNLKNKEGILIKADTLGSLEALINILSDNEIQVRRALIGKVTKKDIIDVAGDVGKNETNAIILNFAQKIDSDIEIMAKEYGVHIISNDIIYKLIEDANLWIENKRREIERKKLENLQMPFKIKILSNCIFRTSNPAIIGVEVLGGVLTSNSPLVTEYGKKVGVVKSIKNKDKYLKKLSVGESAAISVDNLIIGRHAQEDSNLYSFMGEENFRKLKKNADLLSKTEKNVLKEIASIMRKENSLWGI